MQQVTFSCRLQSNKSNSVARQDRKVSAQSSSKTVYRVLPTWKTSERRIIFYSELRRLKVLRLWSNDSCIRREVSRVQALGVACLPPLSSTRALAAITFKSQKSYSSTRRQPSCAPIDSSERALDSSVLRVPFWRFNKHSDSHFSTQIVVCRRFTCTLIDFPELSFFWKIDKSGSCFSALSSRPSVGEGVQNSFSPTFSNELSYQLLSEL